MGEKQGSIWRRFLPLAVFLAALAVALFATGVLSGKANAEGRLLAERNLRRAAVECYALEGFYPQDVEYLAAHYGVTLDERRFLVHYQFVAANLMPQITVLPPA